MDTRADGHAGQGQRPALPGLLTPAEREFFTALRRLVDASGLEVDALAAVTSAPGAAPGPAAGAAPRYTPQQWRQWLDGQSLPPRKAVRHLADSLGAADTDAAALVEAWALAFTPTAYPQEPGTGQPAAQLAEEDEPSSRTLARAGTVFATAYRHLSAPAARLLRLLSEHPGPDVTGPAAASMAALPAAQAARALDELTQAGMLVRERPGRFSCPGRFRPHVAELARLAEPDAERQQALERLLDHYLRSMAAAVAVGYPPALAVPGLPPRPGVQPEGFGSDRQAREWCEAELRVGLALAARAAERGLDCYGWQLPAAMGHVLARSGCLRDFQAIEQVAVAAAGRTGDPLAAGHAQYHLAHACALLGQVSDGDAALSAALRCFTAAGDQAAAARTLNGMAQLLMQQGDYRCALERGKEALRLRQAVGGPDELAHSEETIGAIYSRLGDYDQAVRHCQRSLDLSRETGARLLSADALTTLGFVHLALGETRTAIATYMEVLAIFQQTCSTPDIAVALAGLGDAQLAAGDSAAAQASWQQALTLLQGLPNADDQPVRARLARVYQPPR